MIRIDNLGKRYRIGARQNSYETLREVIAGAVRSPLGSLTRRRVSRGDAIWALKGLNFDVEPGEIIGIIGKNGAGKSTLLKILSRITEPSAGRVEMYGRAGSLLEVGTGFHPELTGRENVFLNGAILGMKRREIVRKFDEIVAFAEIERFVDTPVKRYSSGMYMRLAFSVAAHLEPEILIVDEVLAVGDEQFQKKCLGKMGEVGKHGRTVLFVSHNMAAVSNLCRRVVVLDAGCATFIGAQDEAVAHYLAGFRGATGSVRDRVDRVGSGEMRVVAVEVRDGRRQSLETVASGQDVDICLHYERAADFRHSNVIAGICVKTQTDVPVFLQHNRLTRGEWGRLPQRGAFICRIPRLPLPPSTYRVTFSLMRNGEYIDAMDDAAELNVTGSDFFGSGEVPPATHGSCLVDAEWRLEAEPEHGEAELEPAAAGVQT
ncbi:MAG: ABC transporter ATP-binding protein [Pyrinomonadaceae bacterium]